MRLVVFAKRAGGARLRPSGAWIGADHAVGSDGRCRIIARSITGRSGNTFPGPAVFGSSGQPCASPRRSPPETEIRPASSTPRRFHLVCTATSGGSPQYCRGHRGDILRGRSGEVHLPARERARMAGLPGGGYGEPRVPSGEVRMTDCGGRLRRVVDAHEASFMAGRPMILGHENGCAGASVPSLRQGPPARSCASFHQPSHPVGHGHRLGSGHASRLERRGGAYRSCSCGSRGAFCTLMLAIGGSRAASSRERSCGLAPSPAHGPRAWRCRPTLPGGRRPEKAASILEACGPPSRTAGVRRISARPSFSGGPQPEAIVLRHW